MLIIGIDPGPTTGIVAVYTNAPPEIAPPRIVQCSANVAIPIVNALVDLRTDLVVLAVEKFVIGRASMRTGHDGAVTQGLIGRLVEVVANRSAVRVIQRSAAEVKPWATDTRLHRAGLFDLTAGMRHTRDAARHALFCGVKDFGLPDPLSAKWGGR